MPRFRKILIWFISIIIILFVILFIAVSFFINSFKSNLEEILTENIGLETKIDGNIALKVMPGVSFVVNKLKVISNETYVLKIEQTEIAVDYLSLLKSDIDINGLQFVNPQVYIVRDSAGKFNYIDEHQQYNLTGDNKSYDLNLSDCRIKNGRLLYIDIQFGDTLMVDGLNLSSDEIGLTGTINNIDADKIRLGGSMKIGRFKLNMLKVDSMQFKIDGRAGKIAIVAVDIGYFGGVSNGKAIFDFTSKPANIRIEHRMTGMDLKLFGESIGNTGIFSGLIDYDLNIGFNSFSWEQSRSTMNGSLSISGENLVIHGVNMNEIIESSGKSQQYPFIDPGVIFFAGPYGAVFTKGINFVQLPLLNSGDSTQITKIISKWNIVNGKANAQDVAFKTATYRLAMTGALDLKNDIYKDISISLINKDGCAAFSQNMNGPFTEAVSKNINNFGAIYGPVGNLWVALTKPLRNPCTPIYKGSVEAPVF